MTIIEDKVFVGTPKVKGSDNAAHTIETDDVLYRRCTFDANGASEAIKGSRKCHIYFENCTIIRGAEDGADFVGCVNVQFVNCIFKGNTGGQDITWKGGSVDLLCKGCHGLRKITAGDYTIYDHDKPGPKSGYISTVDCERPRVEMRWAKEATGDCRVFTWWLWLVFVYFRVRSLWPETGQNKGKV